MIAVVTPSAGEGEVEHEIERIFACLARQLLHVAVFENAGFRFDDFDLRPLSIEQAEVRGGRQLLAN